MTYFKKSYLLFFLSLTPTPVLSKDFCPGEQLKNLINYGNSEHSILVYHLTEKKELCAHNPDNTLSPASVTKLITSAAALAKWGPSHTVKTKIFYSGSRDLHTIQGDLWFVGAGDPFLVSEKLWQLAADIKHLGITRIKGDIAIDDSLFDSKEEDAPRLEGQVSSRHAYDAPVSAFGVNFNTVAIAMAPGVKAGSPGTASLDPYPLDKIILKTKIATTAEGRKAQVEVQRTSQEKGRTVLVASGGVPLHSGPVKLYRSLTDPLALSGSYVKAFLKSQGIEVTGGIKVGDLPGNKVTPLMEVESYELRKVVQGLNNFSNNYIADVLTKRLSASREEEAPYKVTQQGSYKDGVQALAQFLKTDVQVKGSFEIFNGSGLDPANRLSARQLVQLLGFMEGRMDLFPDFLASLPSNGLDGTMKKRWQELKIENAEKIFGLVRAKTGSLNTPKTVASVAGYFRAPGEGMIAFCILSNGKEGKNQPAQEEIKKRQDLLLAHILQ